MVTKYSGQIETEQVVELLYNYIKTAINANLYETRFNSRWSRSNMLGN
jgi:hypothetical protein